MLGIGTVLLAGVLYLGLLFAVAWWGDKFHKTSRQRPYIYSLALGVHCSSWAFYGTTMQSYHYGWAFAPTYAGSILVFVLAFPVLQKIINICQQHNITSLADFIGIRYNQSHGLAAIVTIVSLLGVIPYIALQLDAVTTSVDFIVETDLSEHVQSGLWVALLMALFAIIFGTRSLNLTEKHPGLMLAIAFESIVKLAAIAIVGVFICYVMFDGIFDLLGQVQQHSASREILQQNSAPWVYVSHMVLGVCAMFCLPRQFHINYVENNGEQELRTARWLFPAYLFAINFFVLPIALAGSLVFAEQDISADTFILALPMAANNATMTLVSFVGGLSAATSMVIVATLSLGIMVSNNIITPLWLKVQFRHWHPHNLTARAILNTRRLTVILIIALSYLYYRNISQSAPLVNSGIIAMALLAQFVPSMLLGMYWPKGNKLAAITSLVVGSICWFCLLVWPSIKASYYFDPTPSDISLSNGFLISLSVNLGCYLLLSLLFGRKHKSGFETFSSGFKTQQHSIKVKSMLAITEKILSPQKHRELVERLPAIHGHNYASPELIKTVERELAAHLGNASSRILLSSITEEQQVPFEQLVELVEEASQLYQFNAELLQASLGHIEQGIAVIDRDLRLVAWNQRYIELFDYPDDLIKEGVPVEKLLAFNAERGLLGKNSDSQHEIEKRIAYLRQGSRYKFLRNYPDGKVMEIQGNPMPGGGFVTTYTDISEYVETQRQLSEAKYGLEQKVKQRTKELQQANQALEQAKGEAEQANDSKTKFLAAAGHDLMQPFNAAFLFASMLEQKTSGTELEESSKGLLQSLSSAEALLSMLLDMTKLESGVLKPVMQNFCLADITQPLQEEFAIIAAQKGLELRVQHSQCFVHSDKKLLRRILQNLLSNAIRYTQQGAVLLSCRRKGDDLEVQVLDTGPGIPQDQQQAIFREFHQLEQDKGKQGLGLGLTIVERISTLLKHPLDLQSTLGKGTCFSVTLPRVEPQQQTSPAAVKTSSDAPPLLQGKHVLIIDNEPQILNAMAELFKDWGAKVTTAHDSDSASEKLTDIPHLVLADYYLDHGKTGIKEVKALLKQWQQQVPVILNSANHDENIRHQAIHAGFQFLHKPVKPGALKMIIRKLLG